MSYHYGVPPQHYRKFSQVSPHSSGEDVHYAPYEYATPMKGHRRQASYQPSPRPVGGYFSPAGSPPPEEYVPYTPIRETYVSYDKHRRPSASTPTPRSSTRKARQPSGPIYVHLDGDEYVRIVDRDPPATTNTRRPRKPSTDSYFYFGQEQIYDELPRRSTRTRRSSTTTKTSPQKSRSTPSPPPVATQDDAIRAGIPAGYSLKNWDPSEQPIVLLGSVFDANSFGKWMFDWTAYSKGARDPTSEMAGDLWLLLIKLAGKMKRANDCVGLVRAGEQRDMIRDFIKSGDRLWTKFKNLLKECEYYMMKAAKKQGSKLMMGKNAGTEFVESIFGPDRYLEETERIINSFRVWNMRFDVNCEDIIRGPSMRRD